MNKILSVIVVFVLLSSCKVVKDTTQTQETNSVKITPFQVTPHFIWENAHVYFLLTDRFKNGNPNNDHALGRTAETAVLRGFEGGDLRGVIDKIEDGYFTDLGVNAIWMTPIVEQIHGYTDEGTGKTYAFHGYWAKDWTAIDPAFGTNADLKELVEKAHGKGIRVILDAVVNHTGPVTNVDEVYPNNWVRTLPQCTYKTYETTIACTLVKNLPDVLTESENAVELPKMLIEKWKKESRYEKEISSLNAWFAKTGYPRAPKYYIMKWLADYITEFGIDGYRVDTVKHTKEDVWADFADICQLAFDEYNAANPTKFMGDKDFFLVGEVYGYGIGQKIMYHFPDKKVNYFENGFPALINFDFKSDANKSYEELFSSYSQTLNNEMAELMVMNYLTSHDDGSPFDKNRKKSFEAANKLLLAPGISQIYYGDESARPLQIEGASGDANLRSNMNWDEQKSNTALQNLLIHYQKLGKFRARHLSIGAGIHKMISESPYWFSRKYVKNGWEDRVVVGLNLPKGKKSVNVSSVFEEGAVLKDAYSGETTQVKDGMVTLTTDDVVVLLEEMLRK